MGSSFETVHKLFTETTLEALLPGRMKTKKAWLINALNGVTLRFVAPAYMLPFAVKGLALAFGVDVFDDVWPWLFIPALGLHVVMTTYGVSEATSSNVGETEDPLITSLREGFLYLEFDKGLKALADLQHEYLQIQPLLNVRRDTDPISISQIAGLAKETYEQAVSVLGDALILARAVNTADKERLQADIGQLKGELQPLDGDAQEGRGRLLRERLSSSRDLLDLMSQQELRLEDLLVQSGRCTDSLQRTRIEVAGLRADSSEEAVNAVTRTLISTINRAKEVQEELKKLGV